MAPQVGRDDVEVATEIGRDPVPAPTMVATAVHEQQRRLVRVAPVDEVELQPLRVEIVRRRAEDALAFHHRASV